jgi:hypothetical protein
MANTTIPLSQMAMGANADPAGTAIVAANTHTITPSKGWRKLLVRVSHTTASAKVVTFTAGDSPPADASGQGDLAVSFADGSTTPVVKWFLVDSSRFEQSDGSVVITVAASTTGTITAFQLI